MNHDCPFCNYDPDRVFYESEKVIGLWDAYPVTAGHALLITRRHVASWFEATRYEQHALLEGVYEAREIIMREHEIDGFNMGVNIGQAAGQTIPHLHVHLIPRRNGDMRDPRGGVRHVIPDKANYLATTPSNHLLPGLPHEMPLVRGGDDPLLPHLIAGLDRAVAADIAVAFTMTSGTRLLLEHLRDLLARGGRLRFLTGDYLDVTDPQALASLIDLQEEGADAHFRVFESQDTSFHLKSYILHFSDGSGVAYVGSSNLSRQALTEGHEWNYRSIPSVDAHGFKDVCDAFDKLFEHANTTPIDTQWLAQYQSKRRPPSRQSEVVTATPEVVEAPPEPHPIQEEALAALEQTRDAGNTAGLVVLATGLGKTWLSAFDSNRAAYKRILFVAHREEILNQAIDTFRRILPLARLGRYTGQEKTADADVLFASVQTLGRQHHLKQFDSEAFDYIVIDEFHHAAAKTYRNLINHFEPKFMLGLTATPERTDGGDLLGLCQENLVFSCGVPEGIRRDLLCPFKYYGVPDLVDYENIPWRSNRFDEEALTEAVATQKRAENTLEQYQKIGGKRTIGFCCSKRHADFMAEYFRDKGLRAVAVHSGEKSAPRAGSLEQLSKGEISIIFAVDMFNEGVDVPDIDSVLMLRPTESAILWMQQFGRGLRKSKDKILKVVDYIGNHRVFLNKPRTLLNLGANLGAGDGSIAHALQLVEKGEWELPAGCEVTYDLEAISILRSLLKIPRGAEVVEAYYQDYKYRHGVRPTASEVMHDGFNPRTNGHGSWTRFIWDMGDWPEDLRPDFERLEPFFESLEKTPMTKSYKMLVLLAMLNADQLPGSIEIDALVEGFARQAKRSAILRNEVGPRLEQAAQLRKLVLDNPVNAWAGGLGTGNHSYFALNGETFETTLDIAPHHRTAFQEFVRELVEWRLGEHLRRTSKSLDIISCKVIQSNGRPILMLPDREKNQAIPEGETPIVIEGKDYEADFLKIAVEVIRQGNSHENLLPELLKKWFGPKAGQPDTSHQVTFNNKGDHYELLPLLTDKSSLVWQNYKRDQIPGLFGVEYNGTFQMQGFVIKDQHVFLLVTLDKNDLEQDHQYEDRFLSPDRFQWQSQNRTTQQSRAGQVISRHKELGYDVHLFLRKARKHGGRTSPFLYCGDLDFVSWDGEKPITVQWKLREPVPEQHRELLGIESSSEGQI